MNFITHLIVMRIFFSFLITALFTLSLFGQDEPILLKNPSFEGIPNAGARNQAFVLDGWIDCGFPGESPPDLHSANTKHFNSNNNPAEGKTYLGMVVRSNDTWESISQRLSAPLVAGKCYSFTLSLRRSASYLSKSATDTSEVEYTAPAILRIWGGEGVCNKAELLDETTIVTNMDRWIGKVFNFKPKSTHNYIVIEAYYNSTSNFRYNGNILIDNASPIYPEPCNVEEPVVAEPKVVEEPPAPKPKILGDLDRSKLQKGQTIRIDQLYFKADSSSMTDASLPVLDEIYDFLAANPDVVVEIGGHTNGIPSHEYCDRLSAERAKAVADFLNEKGIPRERLQYKGYGKRQPVDSNRTQAGRQKNQRVEIKILSFNG